MAQAFLGTTGKKPKAPTIPKLTSVVKKPTVKKKVIQPQQTQQATATSDTGITQPWLPQLQSAQPVQPMQQFQQAQPQYNVQDLISQQYEQQRQAARLSKLNELRQQQAGLSEQESKLGPAYQQARTDVDVQSQQKARRLKELLGGMGLAEGTQAMQQTQLGAASQQAITGLGQQEQAARDDIARQQQLAESAYSGSMSEIEAALAAQQTGDVIAQAQLAQQQALSQQQQQFENQMSQRQMDLQQQGFTADEAYRQSQLEMQQAGLTGQYQGQATLPYLEATRPKAVAPTDTTTTVPQVDYDQIAALYKTNPGLAQSYVQSLNLPNYQFNKIMESLQVEPTAPTTNLSPYQDFIRTQNMDANETSQYVSNLLSRGAITQPEADQLKAVYDIPSTGAIPLTGETPAAGVTPTKESIYARYANNELTQPEYYDELDKYGY